MGSPPLRRVPPRGIVGLAWLIVAAAAIGLALAGAASSAPPDAPQLFPNDPGFQAYQAPLRLIDAPAAWAVSLGSPAVTIGVVDTDITALPDFGSGLVPGWNVFGGNDNPVDEHGHGTAVASTLGARLNDGVGIAGICAACGVMPVRISDASARSNGRLLADGITWAATHGARVINVSFQQDPDGPLYTPLQDAVNATVASGAVVVLIAGNYGRSDPPANQWASSNPNAIRVAGVDLSGGLNGKSNRGAWTDIAAPWEVVADTSSGSFAHWQGTSFSGPLVSGVAALMLAADPLLTPADVKSILLGTGTKVAGLDVACGCVVNAYNALIAARVRAGASVTLTVRKEGTGAGRVRDAAARLDCGDACSTSVTVGTTVTLSAQPDGRSAFAGWGGACSGDAASCTLTLGGDAEVTAAFEKRQVRIVVKKIGRGVVTSAPAGISCGTRCATTEPVGDVLRLKARSAKGFRFVRWSGGCSGRRPTCTLHPSAPATIVAVFGRSKTAK